MQTRTEKTSSNTAGLIDALQNILARSRVIIPDLETPYSRFPNTDHSTINRKDLSISAIVTERQQQVHAVLDEISGLTTIMDSVKNFHQQLVEKREKITQSLNLHKGLVSPLSRVPTEVLALIFYHCLPEFHRWQHHSFNPKRDAPMLLTRICRRWRDVVVDMPTLWHRLYLTKHKNWEQAALCYDSWLKRSRGFPLSLALLCYKNDETKLRGVIQPYISQISCLYVDFFTGANPEPVLKDITALRELTVGLPKNDTSAISQLAHRLPSTLRSLRLLGPTFTFKLLPSLSAIFAQLTNIEIAVHDSNTLLRLLQLSPNLSSLTSRLGSGRLERALEPFTHDGLRSLHLFCGYLADDTLRYLFNALSLPNLRMLEARARAKWPHKELKALLARSNCPLESLHFGNQVTTDEERAEYIALMPSLKVYIST